MAEINTASAWTEEEKEDIWQRYLNGETQADIYRVVRETGQVRTNGFTEIYVNAAKKNYDDELNTNVSDYMDLFVDRDTLNPEKFPAFSKRKYSLIKTKKGENEMCEKVDQLTNEKVQEAVLLNLFEGVQDGGTKITYAAKKAELSLNDFKDQMRLRGFKVPQRKRRVKKTPKS